MTSAYPLSHDTLVARVRQLVDELGYAPSQRRVMQECGVGRDRAKAAISDATAPAPQISPLADAPGRGAEDEQEAPTAPALHVVPDIADEPVQEHSAPAEITHEPVADAPRVQDTPAEPVPAPERRPRVPRWPLLIIALGAFVAIWSGWVGLGRMAGFGPVELLPGIADGWTIDSAITLPLGVEAYAAYAMWAWLAPAATGITAKARRFARWSALAALSLGLFGQAAYHLLKTAGVTVAPTPVVIFVSSLPVLVLGAGAALAHLIHGADEEVSR